jgi:phage terminase small subunit
LTASYVDVTLYIWKADAQRFGFFIRADMEATIDPVKTLNPSERKFAEQYLATGNATQSYIDAYPKVKNRATAAVLASRVLKKVKVSTYIKQVQDRATDETIMSVIERKQRLTTIGRAKITDFVTPGGNIEFDPDSPTAGAVGEYKISEFQGGKDGRATMLTKDIKLLPAITAIDTLNKMEGIYSEGPQVNIDQRTIEVYVYSSKGAKLVKRIASGEGTKS